MLPARKMNHRTIAIGAALLMGCTLARAQAYVHVDGAQVRLGNRFLERTIEVRDGVVGTVSLRNQLSGHDYALSGDEFQLRLIYERVGYGPDSENPWVLTARDFQVAGREITAEPDGGQRVTYHLALRRGRFRRPRLTVDLVYEIRPEEFFMRQWLQLAVSGTGTYFMDSVAVLRDRLAGAPVSLGGFGQPLFAGDLFLGLEYPASSNTEDGEVVSLARIVGENIPPQGFVTQPAVIGVAPGGGAALHRQFMAYVDRIRVAPVRPYLLYNTWYDLQSTHMNGENTLERVAEFKRILVEHYGLHLDSFVLDDSWDDFQNLWRIDPKRFPNGFSDLTAALRGAGSGLGLWFGPIGGYSHRQLRLAAGRRIGMEITTNGQFLCLAGRNYSRYFTDAVTGYEKQYGINYFKIDGTPFGCNDPSHGHPVGIYSREADMRVLIGLLRDLRQENPKVFLNITTSIWLSPWWLRYADTVWMGGADSGYLPAVPTLTPRQSAISYRDSVLYDDFARQRYQFPMSSIMTHGIIKGRYNELGGTLETAKDWDDAVVHYFSVGNMMYELYISPDELSAAQWDALAGGIRWAEAHAHPLLDNSTFVLGDPARREPYGFVHASPADTIVTLRNPFVVPRTATLALTADNGFTGGDTPLAAEVVYPYRERLPGTWRAGDTLNVELGAYEQQVIELRPLLPRTLTIEGARYEVSDAGPSGVTLDLYAPEGATRPVRIVGGQTSGMTMAGGLTLHFGSAKAQTPSEPRFTAPQLTLTAAPDAGRDARLQVAATVPADFAEARLAVLLQPPAETKGVTASASDNGRAVTPALENGGRGQWYWFSVPLAPGRHAVTLDMNLPATLPRGTQCSVWLLANRLLARRQLQVRLDSGVAAPPADTLPQRAASQAATYNLLQRTLP